MLMRVKGVANWRLPSADFDAGGRQKQVVVNPQSAIANGKFLVSIPIYYVTFHVPFCNKNRAFCTLPDAHRVGTKLARIFVI
jgi:hypothetical protein